MAVLQDIKLELEDDKKNTLLIIGNSCQGKTIPSAGLSMKHKFIAKNFCPPLTPRTKGRVKKYVAVKFQHSHVETASLSTYP